VKELGNPVVHFEIVAKDAPALRAFYRDTFDWQILEPEVGAGLIDYTRVQPADGAGIGGGIGETRDGYSGHVTFYIHVPDVAAALATVEKRGGSLVMGPEMVPNGPTVGLFRDPGGHVVGLVSGP
jgi:predicted enzyme related to lactoylglutathione lyase